MAGPANVGEFLDLVRRSGVVTPQELDTFIKQQGGQAALPGDPRQLAGLLLQKGVLTHFQAEQFLRGRWRGFTIGKYKVLQQIGSGGMGDVYLCEHIAMRRRVAVKVMPPAKAEDPIALARFHREARILTGLDHPNLVRAFDIGQDGHLHYLVMEFVEGINLQDLVTRNGKLPVAKAADYMRQSAAGLEYLHQAGLVHRDIKPSNILVDRQGIIKILDMGLARFFQDEKDAVTQQFDDKSVLGTADYLSPEQARSSSDVDIRTDIYSLGATFYFLLAGKPPFAEGKVAQKLIWHQIKPPPPIREQRPEVPEEIAAIINKMLAKDPAQRYPTPAALVEALAPWGTTPVSLAKPKVPVEEPAPAPGDAAALEETPRPVPPTQKDPASILQQRDSRETAFNLQMPTLHEKASALQARLSQLASTESGTETPSPRKERPALAARLAGLRRLWRLDVAIAAAVGLALAGFGVVLWKGFTSARTPPVTQLASTEPERPVTTRPLASRLLVTRSGQENTYATLRDALAKARPGDRVLVVDETLEEALQLEGGIGKDVIVEGVPTAGKPVVWKPPASLKEGQPLLDLQNVPGLRLKGFVIDGQERVRDLISLSGRCPDVRLEEVRLQGFQRSAVRLAGCAGIDNRPVLLLRVRVRNSGSETEAAVLFEGNASEHIHLRDCRLEGPFRSAVQLAAPVSEFVCQRNRFFRAADGLLYRKAEPRHRIDLLLTSNTFCDVQRPLHLECLPAAGPGNRLAVENNLFVRASQLVAVDDFRLEPKSVPASWVWFNEGKADPGKTPAPETRCFRRAFVVPDKLASPALLNITCDDQFTAWVNGQQVGKGQFKTRKVQVFDVSRHIRPAKNVLAIEGTSPGKVAGLLVQLTFTPQGGKERTLVSDATWRAARAAPKGWQEIDFDDSGWSPVRVVAPYSKATVPAWKNLVWDSEFVPLTKGALWPLIAVASNNVACKGAGTGGAEFFLQAQAAGDDKSLATDPDNDSRFLRYPRTDPLGRAGPNNTPVGVPPVD